MCVCPQSKLDGQSLEILDRAEHTHEKIAYLELARIRRVRFLKKRTYTVLKSCIRRRWYIFRCITSLLVTHALNPYYSLRYSRLRISLHQDPIVCYSSKVNQRSKHLFLYLVFWRFDLLGKSSCFRFGDGPSLLNKNTDCFFFLAQSKFS